MIKKADKYHARYEALEKDLVETIDFKRQFYHEIKLARKLWASKDFATSRTKQLQLKRLGVAMDLKMLFQQMEAALDRNDVKTYNSLALVFHEKYGKYLAAHTQPEVLDTKHGVVVLPMQKRKRNEKTKTDHSAGGHSAQG